MKIKKSNLLLLGFYLTLVFGFIAFLVGARNYIDTNYSIQQYDTRSNEVQSSVISEEINHLVFRRNSSIGELNLANETRIEFISHSIHNRDKAFEVRGDTLIINEDVHLIRLELARGMKSVHYQNSEAYISTRVLERNAQISAYGNDHFSLRLYCDGEDLEELNLDLEDTEFVLDFMNEGEEFKIHFLKADLNNARLVFSPVGEIKTDSFEVKSRDVRDHISAPFYVIEKMKLERPSQE